MSIIHTWTLTHRLVTSSGTDTKQEENYAITGDIEMVVDETITADQTDTAVGIAIDSSRVESILFEADTGLTIDTNSTSTPDDTITLNSANNYTVYWSTSSGGTNPVNSADVTTLYVTENDSTAGTLKIRVLLDKDDS